MRRFPGRSHHGVRHGRRTANAPSSSPRSLARAASRSSTSRTGAETTLDLDLDVAAATWRPNHDQLVLTTVPGDNRRFWVVNIDGTGRREIPVSPYAINGADGVTGWHTARVLDLGPVASGRDQCRGHRHRWRPLGLGGLRGWIRLAERQSSHPTVRRSLSHRFVAGTYQSQLGCARCRVRRCRRSMLGPLAENPPPDFAVLARTAP